MASAAYLTADATVSAHKATAIIANDSTVFPQPTRGIYVGSGGNLFVDMADGGNSILFTNVPGGQIFPVQVTRVYLTGTTAGGLVALY